jgi:four helix bundle protein
MSKIERFEDLRCWQAARQLARFVFLSSEEAKLAKDFATRDQIRRAALSVMNNIAEGFGRKSNLEFIRFLDFAQSSAQEVKSITYLLEDLNYLAPDSIMKIRQDAEACKSQILALIAYLRKRKSN